MRRRIARLSPLAALAICTSADAVIRYADGDPTSHTMAPTGSFANSGWQWVGQDSGASGFCATAIGPHTFITAAHVTPGGNVTFNGIDYPILSTTLIGGTDPAHSNANRRDLVVVNVGGDALTSWAPLYKESVDGSLLGKTAVMIGRGTQRSTEVNVATSRGTEGTLRGWNWGPQDGVQRWGTNVINNYFIDGTPPINNDNREFVGLNFDLNGLSDEAIVSGGDSGGPMFVKSASGVWKLAGVNFGVDQYRTSATGDNLFGAIFDLRDLYAQDNTGNWVLQSGPSPIPMRSYISNISDAISTAPAGDANDDGTVNTLDFNMLASNFNLQSGGNWLLGDFNGDGAVNALDFNVLATNFGHVTAATSGVGTNSIVPEPGALAIIGLATIAMHARRSRRR